MQLHELLALERPLIVFDLETTGPMPQADRVVEIGFIELKPDGTTREWSSFINPLMPIPHEATYGNPATGYDGHGITDEMVADAPTFKALAPSLMRGFNEDADYGGYNIKTFDVLMLAAEFARCGYPEWSFANSKLVDGFRLWQLGEERTLSHASERFLGRKHEGAHRVLDDVRTSLAVITAQIILFQKLPRNVRDLHAMQWPPKPNAIDPDGKFIWKDGVATVNFGKKWKGIPLHMMKQKDLRWIATDADGINAVAKQICRDALNGKFPEPPAQALPPEEENAA